jgi:DNA polymerase II large subunit
MICSEEIQEYFNYIKERLEKEYAIANKARSKGYDPEFHVDIPLAKDVADRVEKLIGAACPQIVNKGLPVRIRDLEKQYGSGDWRIALIVSQEVADEKFGKFDSLEKAIETGIRIGLAYITLAVTAAPLEGFVELKMKKRSDGKPYLSLFFAGPIRAAGGTAVSVCLLIADYIRKNLEIAEYDPFPMEIKRYQTEIKDYNDLVSRLQYLPSDEEISFLVENIPLEINGDPTTQREVSQYKDLERIETNKIRGGMCLVIGEGIAQKADKVLKQIKGWGKDFNLDNWDFLKEYSKIHKKKLAGKKEESEEKIVPIFRFMEEAVAGRPIFSHPMTKGGFRLRYGRTRLTGLGAAALNPVTMATLDHFIAVGSQLRVERPGKACAITPCDYIDGPIVLLDNGAVIRLASIEQYESLKFKIKKILFNGDILFNYGDFLEQDHMLVPSPYVEEWWILDLKTALKKKGEEFLKQLLDVRTTSLLTDPIKTPLSAKEAIKISKFYEIPLYPRYIYYWSDIPKEDLLYLLTFLPKNTEISEKLSIVLEPKIKKILELLGLPHYLRGDMIIVEGSDATAFIASVKEIFSTNQDILKGDDSLDIINQVSSVKIMNKAPVYVGARLGRPEKAKLRKLKGRPQVLFPVGAQGGRLRSFNHAYEKGSVYADFPLYFCEQCKKQTMFKICEDCKKVTKEITFCYKCNKMNEGDKCECGNINRYYKRRKIDIRKYLDRVIRNLNVAKPPLIKGVRGTTNKKRIPEPLEKGVLRAKHNVYVNKDGTIRYDAIEVPVTHFKPKEVGTTIEKLKELGYENDINDKLLKEPDQILELKPQDIILPGCTEWQDADASNSFIKIANFVDDMLLRFYKLEPYYNVKTKEDLVGHLIIGLAPHTSAGTIGRIVGFSKNQGFFAHPYFHSALRRNCDGDEAAVMLSLEALLDFSRQYLPDVRGGRSMDAPLVLTAYLDPNEIDTEAHNLDIVDTYTPEFYQASLNWEKPYNVKIKTVKQCLGKPEQLEGLRYTHPVSDMNDSPLVSAYKTLTDMTSKITHQMALAGKIRAVKKEDVASLIIEKHFLRDIKGNLRRYSTQSFRCIDCNTIYRRIPLMGRCLKCKGKIILTVSEGTVSKYLQHSLTLAEKYNLTDYLKQTLNILSKRVESIFGKEPTKQISLTGFISSE